MPTQSTLKTVPCLPYAMTYRSEPRPLPITLSLASGHPSQISQSPGRTSRRPAMLKQEDSIGHQGTEDTGAISPTTGATSNVTTQATDPAAQIVT
ncbi:hypothetical protein PSHT_03111 [Puccinia striiformis]|uniref:Uncharacterized protein n=1 Tax=Puccinia striiformis TaxID=27350 RepID=A0A2S4WGE5_9BASI|nr:hypothetical protein PSHT_03111 [Puccinia striiformis]